MRRFSQRIVFFMCFLVSMSVGAAQEYPSKPIRLVMPFGGGAAAIARVVAHEMGERLGQTVVVESLPGAGGTIAAAQVARAKPDGYTILWGTHVSQVSRPLTMKDPPYDPVNDFAAVGQISMPTYAIAVNPELDIATLGEFIAYGKRNQSELAVGTFGSPALGQLYLAQLEQAVPGFKSMNVPFVDEGQAVAAAIGKHVQGVIGTLSSLAASGDRLRILAIFTDRRRDAYSNVPTVTEALGSNFQPLRPISGIWAPVGVPKEVVEKLNEVIVDTVNAQNVRDLLVAGGSVPQAGTPQQLETALLTEIEAARKAIQSSGLVLD